MFLDQSYWQNTIAAKPAQGIWGFLCAAFCVLILPVAFGTAVGCAYAVLKFKAGSGLHNPSRHGVPSYDIALVYYVHAWFFLLRLLIKRAYYC